MGRVLLAGATLAACRVGPARRGRTVIYASGADLQSINPLFTSHPLAKQVQRYVLLTTLARYDSALVPQPYLARRWTWSADLTTLTFRLQPGVRWHDGIPTTARDVAWTLNSARDSVTGYPRLNDLRDIVLVSDADDSTVVVRFGRPERELPDVFTDLAVLPAHAAFVRRSPDLTVLDYPLIFPDGIVFNTRRPPFDDARVRRAVALALDRREIVDGYLYGFGTVADGPVPPDVPGYVPGRPILTDPDSARRLLGGRTIAFELLTVGSGEAPLEQMIQARLAGVGVRASIRQLELSAFLDRVNPRRHDFAAAVLGTAGDPGLGYLGQLADLAGLRAPADPATDQRLFRDSLPIAFLYHARGVQGMNRRVQGVRMDVRGELPAVTQWRIGP